MKKIFTVYTFLLLQLFSFSQGSKTTDVQKGLACKVGGLNITTANQPAPKKDTAVRIVIRCAATRVAPGNEPLIVVDGIPVERENLSALNPNDIEEITILKDAAASAIYGHQAARGAIIVTTKGYKLRAFMVKDFLSGEAVSGATVRFTRLPYKKDTLSYAADENGFISTSQLVIGGFYEAVVTSVGYKPLTVSFNTSYVNRPASFLLERDVKEYKPVVVSATVCPKRISCGYSITKVSDCSMRMLADTVITNSLHPDLNLLKETKIYPNPVNRGQPLTITTLSEQNNSLQIIVTDLSGKTVLQELVKASKGSNQFVINTDSRWTAGMYMAQLKDEKGLLLKTEKIIVR